MRESLGLEGPAGGGGVSAHLCQGRHPAGVRKCASHAPSSSTSNLTPKSAGLPRDPKKLLMGERTRLAEGKPGEVGAQPGPQATQEAPRYQPCPALPPLAICLIPGVPVPPAAGFAHVMPQLL